VLTGSATIGARRRGAQQQVARHLLNKPWGQTLDNNVIFTVLPLVPVVQILSGTSPCIFGNDLTQQIYKDLIS
jgi:hypothetical protein